MMQDVPTNKFATFMQMVKLLSVELGIYNSDKTITWAIDELDNAITSKIMSSNSKKGNQAKINEFILIYKNMYEQSAGFECKEVMIGAERTVIDGFLKKLEEISTRPEEYLDWFFKDFMETSNARKNIKAPNVKLVCSSSMLSTFMFDNKELIQKNKDKMKIEAEEVSVLNKCRVILRETSDMNVAGKIKAYRDGEISIWDLKEFALSYVVRKRKKHSESDGIITEQGKENQDGCQQAE